MTQRTQYVTTSDGVALGATVRGEGSPLVFLQGAVGDCDIDWTRVVDHLDDRFTCHLLSQRGRGLSGDHPDLSPGRLADDVLTYIDSLGEPTGLVGWSGGGTRALDVAARSDAVSAVAPFEPGILTLMDEQEQAVVGGAIGRTAELAAAGDPTAAVRAFLAFPFHDDEIAVADSAGYPDAAARYAVKLLNLLQQAMEHADPAADPDVLATISVPVLVLVGSDTKPFFTKSARFVADHAANASVQEIAGAAHAAPLTHPDALAGALTEFFAATPGTVTTPVVTA